MMNPMQLIQLIRSGGDPQQLVMSILQQNSNNNPILSNLLECAQHNDVKAIENVARNICKEKGVDFDQAFSSFKQNLGL